MCSACFNDCPRTRRSARRGAARNEIALAEPVISSGLLTGPVAQKRQPRAMVGTLGLARVLDDLGVPSVLNSDCPPNSLRPVGICAAQAISLEGSV